MRVWGNRHRVVYMVLKITDRLSDKLFARCFNYFADSRYWHGRPHHSFDYDTACPASRRARMATVTLRIHFLIGQRYVRMTDWSKVERFGPALHVSVHGQPAFTRPTLHLAGESRVAEVRRYGDSRDQMAGFHPAIEGTERLTVDANIVENIGNAVAEGASVVLWPDSPGKKIIATCFKLVEQGTPVVFEYPTVDADGVPRLYRQRYEGEATTEACGKAFVDFLGSYNQDWQQAKLYFFGAKRRAGKLAPTRNTA